MNVNARGNISPSPVVECLINAGELQKPSVFGFKVIFQLIALSKPSEVYILTRCVGELVLTPREGPVPLSECNRHYLITHDESTEKFEDT